MRDDLIILNIQTLIGFLVAGSTVYTPTSREAKQSAIELANEINKHLLYKINVEHIEKTWNINVEA